jgi:hypothetical protein
MVRCKIRAAFQCLPWIDLEEALAEATAAAIQSLSRIRRAGKDPSRFLGRIAAYAVSHVRNGRHVGGSRTSADILSARAQHLHGFHVVSLSARHQSQRGDRHDAKTILDELKASTVRTPVCDAAAFRIDFPQFLDSLSSRDREMAVFLGAGHPAKAAACRFRLSPGRITQLRQQWRRAWVHSQRDPCETRVITPRGKDPHEQRQYQSMRTSTRKVRSD